MLWQAIEAIATSVAALGSIIIAIIAIWGDYFRYRWARPKLVLSLDNPRGEAFPRSDGRTAYYFHLKVRNRRNWSPAQDVRVLVNRAARPRPNGAFVLERLVYPLPLAWTPRELGEFQRTVFDTEICDLGYLVENSDRFRLSTLISPSNFHDYVTANDAVRLRVQALGRNVISEPLFLEIRWTGKWDADRDAMQKHLSVEPIKAL